MFFPVVIFTTLLEALCFFGNVCDRTRLIFLVVVAVSALQLLIIINSNRLLLRGISFKTLLIISVLVAMVIGILIAGNGRGYLIFYPPITGALVVASQVWLQKRKISPGLNSTSSHRRSDMSRYIGQGIITAWVTGFGASLWILFLMQFSPTGQVASQGVYLLVSGIFLLIGALISGLVLGSIAGVLASLVNRFYPPNLKYEGAVFGFLLEAALVTYVYAWGRPWY